MAIDPSHGWNAIADEFVAARSDIGAEVVRRWARRLPSGGAVVDVGCGLGAPVSAVLVEEGFRVFGIDASAALVAAFRRRFPSAEVAREAAETSGFFGRRFDGAVAIGLLFLLPADDQREVIDRVARALEPGGRFLFSAPRQPCEWNDSLTGRPSVSLGEEEYRRALERAGLRLAGHHVDEGQNDYFDAVRTPA
jgi:SAM-dependent methyltransferase